jgi:hypothetical protein
MIPRWTPVRRALVLLAMAAIAVLSATAGVTVFPEISKRSIEPTALLRAMYTPRRTHVRSLARRKPGVQIPSPPPPQPAGQSVVGASSAALS